MTFVFSGFSFILHLAHQLASLSRSSCRYSAVKSILLLTAHCIASVICKLRLVSLVVTWIWHVIDIDKEMYWTQIGTLWDNCFWVNFWRQETFNFDLCDSSNKKIGEPPTKLGGQTKLVNFVLESIVPNIVECFFDI